MENKEYPIAQKFADGRWDKPEVFFEGENGNVFNLAGICIRALKVFPGAGDELKSRITGSSSYDEALQVMMDYVDPS